MKGSENVCCLGEIYDTTVDCREVAKSVLNGKSFMIPNPRLVDARYPQVCTVPTRYSQLYAQFSLILLFITMVIPFLYSLLSYERARRSESNTLVVFGLVQSLYTETASDDDNPFEFTIDTSTGGAAA